MIWNFWDERVGWVRRVQALVHEHVEGAPQQASSAWATELAATGLFGPPERAQFPNVVVGDLELLRARVASVSYISALPAAQRERVLDAVGAVVAADPSLAGRDEFEMPYTTAVTWCRAR